VSPGTRTGVREYRPFPDHDTRNARQRRLEVPVMLRALGVPYDARILEVGCGRGVALPAIREHRAPARLVGLDIDSELLSDADRTHAELVCGDVRAMPFPDASFDVCLDFGTCYHIARPLDALREIARVLRPGGRFCHETPLSQLISHPVRWGFRLLPWSAVPELEPARRAGLWSVRLRTARVPGDRGSRRAA
jgi:ubiquinone/menaquinone biosynthesis C-methylase UbiE